MKISRIQIENFRAIQSYEGDISDSINVYYGENGVGKSTLVTAISYLLSWLTARLLNAKGNGKTLTDEDISTGASHCKLSITLTDGTQWMIYRQRKTIRAKSEQSDLRQLSGWADRWVNEHRDADGAITELPTVGIFNVNRSVVDVPQRLVHQKSLLPESIYSIKTDDFKSFFHWFREREDVENETLRTLYNRNQLGDGFNPDPQLSAVRAAVLKTMPQYENLHVKRSPRKFVIEKNGVEYDFSRLSDGEKCYITLVASIARRLSVTHPNSQSILDEDGIFVIDEIDLHLHPQWQRQVIGRLRETFPHCQFILTTHSPSVLSSIRTFANEHVYMVNDGTIHQRKGKIFGADVSDILLRDFAISSARSIEAEHILDEVRGYLENGDILSEEYQNARVAMLQKLDPTDNTVMALLAEELKLRRG